jgi:hypothetical protein
VANPEAVPGIGTWVTMPFDGIPADGRQIADSGSPDRALMTCSRSGTFPATARTTS